MWVCVVLALASADPPIRFGSRVVSSLNQQDFDRVVGNGACGLDDLGCPKGRLWVIDFYAPWCPHCRRTAPVWSKLADKYHKLEDLRFGAVNCDESSTICNRFKVKAYPTIRAFVSKPGGKHVKLEGSIQFDGKHTFEDMDKFVRITLRDSLHIIDTTDWAESHHKKMSPAPAPSPPPTFAAVSGYVVTQRDLAAGIFFWLAQGVFAPTETKLSGERLVNVLAWTSLLARQLPGIAVPLHTLEAKLAQQASWTEPEFRMAWADMLLWGLDSGTAYSQCGGYSCALWQIFHSLLQNSGEPATETPLSTLQAIRRFVAYFFGCEKCQQHFAQMSRSLELEISADAKRKDAALWLWRAHNSVTRRVASEAGHPPNVYPSTQSCPKCKEKKIWDESQVYLYLRAVYAQPSPTREVATVTPATHQPAFQWPKHLKFPKESKHESAASDKKHPQPVVVDSCNAGETDCDIVCKGKGTPGRRCITETEDIGLPGLQLMCQCSAQDQEPTPSPPKQEQGATTAKHASQNDHAEGTPGTHWEDKTSKKLEAKSKAELAKHTANALSESQENKRNMILIIIISVVIVAVVIGVVVHHKVSKSDRGYSSYINCWNSGAAVAPSYSQVKTHDEDEYDPFGEKIPTAHPAQ